jgi:hypothetical protein
MELGAQGQEVAFDVALVHTGLGDTDAALDWFARAIDARAVEVYYLGVTPSLASLRSDARFQGLLRRMNIPDQGGS